MILGHGIDLVDIARMCRLVEKEAFIRKVFTEKERAYCSARADAASSYAARYAAKEAVAKALGTGIGAQCALLDVEVAVGEQGEPVLLLSGNARRTADQKGVARWHASLSHDGGIAMASVIAEG